jgi:transcriptional regulator with XRE-family HTH domain
MTELEQIKEDRTTMQMLVSESDIPQTAAPSIAPLTESVGSITNNTKILHDDASELHSNVLLLEWKQRTSNQVRLDMQTLLSSLADLGFSWRDIAHMIGVSVPAVQKWRQGGSAKGESRTNAAALLAAVEMIKHHYLVLDVASWFESPVVLGAPLTPMDIYAKNRADKVFQLASGNAHPESVLDEVAPGWRDKYRSEYEVFRANDGELSLRQREN